MKKKTNALLLISNYDTNIVCQSVNFYERSLRIVKILEVFK